MIGSYVASGAGRTSEGVTVTFKIAQLVPDKHDRSVPLERLEEPANADVGGCMEARRPDSIDSDQLEISLQLS